MALLLGWRRAPPLGPGQPPEWKQLSAPGPACCARWPSPPGRPPGPAWTAGRTWPRRCPPSQGGMYIRGAILAGQRSPLICTWRMIRHRCLPSTICAFHLGFGLGVVGQLAQGPAAGGGSAVNAQVYRHGPPPVRCFAHCRTLPDRRRGPSYGTPHPAAAGHSGQVRRIGQQDLAAAPHGRPGIKPEVGGYASNALAIPHRPVDTLRLPPCD